MSASDPMENLLIAALQSQYPGFSATPKNLEMTQQKLVGQIGFRSLGGLGSIGIVGDASDLPMCGVQPEEIDYEDWIGELANQTVGRLKRETLPALRDVAVTTPVVLRSVQLSVADGSGTRVFELHNETQSFWIWFDLSAVDLDATPEPEPENPMPAGDSLLFF